MFNNHYVTNNHYHTCPVCKKVERCDFEGCEGFDGLYCTVCTSHEIIESEIVGTIEKWDRLDSALIDLANSVNQLTVYLKGVKM